MDRQPTYDVEYKYQGIATRWQFYCGFDHMPTCQDAMRVSIKFTPQYHHRIIERWTKREIVKVPARRMTGDAWEYIA